jgi:predicted transcriptional regulator with HTH domain
MEGGQLVLRKDDLYRADSIFPQGIYLYEVSAGVTASPGQSQDAFYDEAKRNLEAFLKGLSIK